MGMHFRRLIYWGAEQNCSHFEDDIFKYMFLRESFIFLSNFTEVCSRPSIDNKSAFVQKMLRWQAISWTDDGAVHWRRYASTDPNKWLSTLIIPPLNEVERGVYWNEIVRLSVCRHNPVNALPGAILLRLRSNLVGTYLGARSRPSSFMGDVRKDKIR